MSKATPDLHRLGDVVAPRVIAAMRSASRAQPSYRRRRLNPPSRRGGGGGAGSSSGSGGGAWK